MKQSEQGFTLIELVVVIVILGILSAFAIPRFINAETDARIAVINGLDAAIKSTTALSQAQYKIAGNSAATSVDMDGTSVTVVAGSGRPTSAAAGIGTALQSLSGFSVTYSSPTATFQPTNGGSATCQLTYNQTSGAVTATTTGC